MNFVEKQKEKTIPKTPVFSEIQTFSRELDFKVKSYLNGSQAARRGTYPLVKAMGLFCSCAAIYSSLFALPVASYFDGTLRLSLLGFVIIILGLNVLHEAAHRNLTDAKGPNEIISYLMDLCGISSRVYRLKHVGFHHQFTNIYGWDGDISESPIIRMSPEQERWSVHRYQHIYAPVLYMLLTVSWIFNDIERLIFRKIGTATIKRFKKTEITEILFFKLIHIALFIVLPAHVFGTKAALLGYFYVQCILGFSLALIFQVAHLDEGSSFTDRTSPFDWKVHQILTTADFATQNRVADFLMGGLNYQVIHHLYPHVSYRHYPALQKIVAETSREHGVKYREYPTFIGAIVSHLKFLKKMGTAD